MEKINDKLWNWASVLDINAQLQAEKTARLEIVVGVRLMPDAHLGRGSTVGSVIATNGAVAPAMVGVDIGCGMAAVEFDMTASQLPGSLKPFLPMVERAIPAGVGEGHANTSAAAQTWLKNNEDNFTTKLGSHLSGKALEQFGSLGSGNHFFEVCLDERDKVWIVLHSGSRGLGNILGTQHIAAARKFNEEKGRFLEDKDLAYFNEDDEGFNLYIGDMLACQAYALANREQMLKRSIEIFKQFLNRRVKIVQTINCHHNFTQKETVPHPELAEYVAAQKLAVDMMDFEEAGRLRDRILELQAHSRELWITRKGAIKAASGDLGIIPGSMGTRSYIVRGLGNSDSFCSCSHGAGRVHSRAEAKRRYTTKDLREAMGDRVWLESKAKSLVDEIPQAYKSIETVMEDQKDLVEPIHTLSQILSYKGA